MEQSIKLADGNGQPAVSDRFGTPGNAFIQDQWYVAACLREVPRNRPLILSVCGQPIRVRRTSSGVDVSCADTGRPLPAKLSEDLVWLYVGDDKPCRGSTLPLPEFNGPRGRVRFMERVTIPADQDNAVYGLLDPAHTPFVHRSPIWRRSGKLKQKKKTFEPSDMGFTMVPHAPVNSDIYKLIGGSISVRIYFRLPGLRAEYIQNAKHTVLGLTALTPIDEKTTALRQIFYWNTPVLWFLKPIAGPISRGFLQQDVDIMALRNENLCHGGKGMLLGDSDRQFLWYVQLKKAWKQACETGAPFANPLEPTTLRWRT